jgi:eukaryotic-like serine/threonine-protein kinase
VKEALTEALRERYQVERELARGGMASVFLARDLRDRQPVAIKVMQPRLATALGAERFLREIDVARTMNHPLIVPVRDSGDVGGILYYVMPFVHGESLYERLQRERRLSLEESLGVARDLAAGLGYAHARGVLHRDVKPENVLLAGGRALLADFGLARAIGAEYTRLTETGVVVGTVHYMSPEQLREDRDLDQRADIYSLGVLLYEMLTGEPPYAATSIRELVTRILRNPVPSAGRLNPGVPDAVDRAIGRAMAKSAADRFPTMEDLVAGLAF